jgi:hypothetical protein
LSWKETIGRSGWQQDLADHLMSTSVLDAGPSAPSERSRTDVSKGTTLSARIATARQHIDHGEYRGVTTLDREIGCGSTSTEGNVRKPAN